MLYLRIQLFGHNQKLKDKIIPLLQKYFYNDYEKLGLVLDTKWKLPEKNIPDYNDLKQMFVYNEFWNSSNAVLVYPTAKHTDKPEFSGGNFLITDDKNKSIVVV